jgi:hypothetical protein
LTKWLKHTKYTGFQVYYVLAVTVKVKQSVLKCYSLLENTSNIIFLLAFEVKFSSFQRFLMTDFGMSGIPLTKCWYVSKHWIASLHLGTGSHHCLLLITDFVFLFSILRSLISSTAQGRQSSASTHSPMWMSHSTSPEHHPRCVDLCLSCHLLHCEVHIFHRIRPSNNSLQSFPNWQHSMICKHGCGIKQKYLVAFLGCCDFLQELANNAPLTFMFQRPDYPSVHWLYDWCAGYFLFNHTFGFPVHGSVANPCMFPESITPSIQRCQFNV